MYLSKENLGSAQGGDRYEGSRNAYDMGYRQMHSGVIEGLNPISNSNYSQGMYRTFSGINEFVEMDKNFSCFKKDLSQSAGINDPNRNTNSGSIIY